MQRISNIKIGKLWNKLDYDIPINTKLNIFIGDNGVGKTTILEIIVSALSLDLDKLNNLIFSSIEIELVDDIIKNQNTIKINKDNEKLKIMYNNKNVKLNNDNFFIENDLSKKRFKTMHNLPYINWLPTHRLCEDDVREKNFFNSWNSFETDLNVNSFKINNLSSNPLDKKIIVLIEKCNKRISEINQKIVEEDQKLRNELIVSNLNSIFKSTGNFSNYVSTKKSVQELVNILSDFNKILVFLEEIKNISNALDEIDNFNDIKSIISENQENLKNTCELLNNKIKTKQKLVLDDVILLTSLSNLLTFNKIFKEYNEKIELIRKDISILKSIFQRVFNPKFNIEIKDKIVIMQGKGMEKDEFDPLNYSSGEKQMLIFILDYFLNLKNEYIYLADEPEISLHLRWQKEYLNIITEGNNHNQYIIATHSPDIVNKHRDSIINLNNFVRRIDYNGKSVR